jgi:hypothetical protein
MGKHRRSLKGLSQPAISDTEKRLPARCKNSSNNLAKALQYKNHKFLSVDREEYFTAAKLLNQEIPKWILDRERLIKLKLNESK